MTKLPAMLFYVGDWLKDPAVRGLTPASRGIWIDLLCAMHELERSGQISGTLDQLARIAYCTAGELVQAIADFTNCRTADVSERGGVYTLVNRRMKREARVRRQTAGRVAVHRQKGGGNPTGWTAIRVRILKRDGYVCAYCGDMATTVDHIVPKCNGGSDCDDNLVASCLKCNTTKGNRTPTEAGMPWPKPGNARCNSPPSSTTSNSREDNPPTSARDRPTACPDLQTVLAWAQMDGVRPVEATRFWNHFESSGWIDKNGNPIVNARTKLATWGADARARPLEAAHKAVGPPSSGTVSASAELILRQNELNRVEAAIKKKRDNAPDHHDGKRPRWVQEIGKLKARRRELLALLGFPDV